MINIRLVSDFMKRPRRRQSYRLCPHRQRQPAHATKPSAGIGVERQEPDMDMFDDHLEIYSPGGMPDGTLIQERGIERVPSMRRNPIIAEIFRHLDYIEPRGSGFNKILTETANLYGYTDAFAPVFNR